MPILVALLGQQGTLLVRKDLYASWWMIVYRKYVKVPSWVNLPVSTGFKKSGFHVAFKPSNTYCG